MRKKLIRTHIPPVLARATHTDWSALLNPAAVAAALGIHVNNFQQDVITKGGRVYIYRSLNWAFTIRRYRPWAPSDSQQSWRNLTFPFSLNAPPKSFVDITDFVASGIDLDDLFSFMTPEAIEEAIPLFVFPITSLGSVWAPLAILMYFLNLQLQNDMGMELTYTREIHGRVMFGILISFTVQNASMATWMNFVPRTLEDNLSSPSDWRTLLPNYVDVPILSRMTNVDPVVGPVRRLITCGYQDLIVQSVSTPFNETLQNINAIRHQLF